MKRKICKGFDKWEKSSNMHNAKVDKRQTHEN